MASDGRILNRPAHSPDTPRPLRSGKSEVNIYPNPTVSDGTDQDKNYVTGQELYNLTTTYPS